MRLTRGISGAGLACAVVLAGCGGKVFPDAADASGSPDAGVSDAAVDHDATATCPPFQTLCGGVCADLAINPSHCGSCAIACGMAKLCVQGKCMGDCPPGQTPCGDTCVDTSSDPNDCGQCGHACGGGFACVNGACTLVCDADAGLTECNGQCVDTSTDPKNCGACNSPCIGTCSGGVCGGGGVFVAKLGAQSFYKVQVSGTMSDTNVLDACKGAGMTVGCSAQSCPQYTDNLCVQTQESSCGNPMLDLAKAIGCSTPATCPQLAGVYQYMGQKWQSGSACGADGGQWCAVGDQHSDRWALCVQ